ncbi:hypothetical protein NC652_006676 [Populus alba x Populus x berolinensis]|nr:hypothetical protein NC652_006676 [Populus alba x Populus x berolinensis]
MSAITWIKRLFYIAFQLLNIFNHRPVEENEYSDADPLWCIKFLSQNHPWAAKRGNTGLYNNFIREERLEEFINTNWNSQNKSKCLFSLHFQHQGSENNELALKT